MADDLGCSDASDTPAMGKITGMGQTEEEARSEKITRPRGVDDRIGGFGIDDVDLVQRGNHTSLGLRRQSGNLALLS